jgi:hypothetical protein
VPASITTGMARFNRLNQKGVIFSYPAGRKWIGTLHAL